MGDGAERRRKKAGRRSTCLQLEFNFSSLISLSYQVEWQYVVATIKY